MPLRGACTGGNDGVTGTTAACTFNLPGTALEGDTLIAVSAQATGTNTESSTGSTSIAGPITPSSSNRTYVWKRTLSAADITAGTVPFPWSGTGRTIGAAAVYYDVDPAGITVATDSTASTTNSFTEPALSTPEDNCDVVRFLTTRVGSGAAPPNVTSWGGTYTQDVVSKLNTTAANLGAYIAHLTTPGAAGAYGGGNITTDANSTVSVFGVISMPPSAVAPSSGTAAGTWSLVGVAVGSEAPSGSGSGTVALAGSAAGSRTSTGSASGSLVLTGATSAHEGARGSAAGGLALDGVSAGQSPTGGSGEGTLALAGSASGSRAPTGSSDGTLDLAGQAFGHAPTVGGNSGVGHGTISFGGAASGTRTPKGSASGSVAFAGSTSGHERARGSAAGGYALAGAAVGQRAPGGSSAGSLDLAGLAHGRNLAGRDIITVLGPTAVRTRTGPVVRWVTQPGPTAVRTRTGPDVT